MLHAPCCVTLKTYSHQCSECSAVRLFFGVCFLSYSSFILSPHAPFPNKVYAGHRGIRCPLHALPQWTVVSLFQRHSTTARHSGFVTPTYPWHLVFPSQPQIRAFERDTLAGFRCSSMLVRVRGIFVGQLCQLSSRGLQKRLQWAFSISEMYSRLPLMYCRYGLQTGLTHDVIRHLQCIVV